MFYSIICFMFSLVASPVPSTWDWPMLRNQNCKQKNNTAPFWNWQFAPEPEVGRWGFAMNVFRGVAIHHISSHQKGLAMIVSFTCFVGNCKRCEFPVWQGQERSFPMTTEPKPPHSKGNSIRVVSNSYFLKAILLQKEYCNSMFCR